MKKTKKCWHDIWNMFCGMDPQAFLPIFLMKPDHNMIIGYADYDDMEAIVALKEIKGLRFWSLYELIIASFRVGVLAGSTAVVCAGLLPYFLCIYIVAIDSTVVLIICNGRVIEISSCHLFLLYNMYKSVYIRILYA